MLFFRMASFPWDIADEEWASAFIVSTCQLLPKSSFNVVSDHIRDLFQTPCPANKVYRICCGSSAEFYIRPLYTCIDDIDYLQSNADELAFSGNIPVLPNDLSGVADSIKCYKIESYKRYPSFAQLIFVGVMKYNWKHKKYEFHHTALTNRYYTLDLAQRETQHQLGTTVNYSMQTTVCGPAVKFKKMENLGNTYDIVESLWCPQWPNDANNWPTRPRKFGWPMIDIISEVVQNGCHVVVRSEE